MLCLLGDIKKKYSQLRALKIEAVSLIEVIEHVEYYELDAVIENVFGFMSPSFVVMTTPNRDFNKFFVSLRENRFRDDDHKFEFSQEEFEIFCISVCHKYGYSVCLVCLCELTSFRKVDFEGTKFKGSFADKIKSSCTEG